MKNKLSRLKSLEVLRPVTQHDMAKILAGSSEKDAVEWMAAYHVLLEERLILEERLDEVKE